MFFNKRDLKGHRDRILITEHLTTFRQNLLNRAKSIVGNHNAWSKKCEIYVKIRNNIYLVWYEDEIHYLNGSSKSNFHRRHEHKTDNSR